MRDLLADIRLKLIALICAALGFLAVALLSWMPAAYRPDIGGVSDKIEHALAYLVLGALTTIALRQRFNPNWIAFAIVAYAGVLELGQALVPSRVTSFEDFVASAVGAIVGVSIVALLIRRSATLENLPTRTALNVDLDIN